MQKLRVLALATVLLAGTASADPALGGGRGLFRMYDARVEEDGALAFANRLVFHRVSSDSTRGNLYGMEISMAPFPFIEAYGSLLGVADRVSNPSSFRYDFQGYALGGKLSFPYLPVAKVGFAVNWLGELSGHYMPEYFDNRAKPGTYWRLLAALRFWEVHKTLPTVMFNYGKGFEKSGTKHISLGLEFPSDVVDIFIEAVSEADSGQTLLKKNSTSYITPGVRLKVPYFLAQYRSSPVRLTGGIELNLNDSRQNRAIAGFNIVSAFPKPEPKPSGQLAGKVEDARTGKPLEAKVKYLNRRGGAMKTDPENGTFYSNRTPVGALLIEATAEGYYPEAAPVSIPNQGIATHVFRLRSTWPVGTIAGRVFDAASNEPLIAEVTLFESGLEPVQTDEATGFFRFDDVPVGLASIGIELEGYVAEQRIADVEEGKAAKLEVGLKKVVVEPPPAQKPPPQPVQIQPPQPPPAPVPVDTNQKLTKPVRKEAIITLQGVAFDFGKAELKSEARPALMEAVRILKENSEVRVEVQGHTDDVGSEEYNQTLSEKRAEAVVEFLVAQGISPTRLVPRGYGEDLPVVSNDTEENRALNRRVDFVIIK